MSELSKLLNQHRKFGVVRFQGTVQFNKNHELAFQTDDAVEAMHELERLCAEDDEGHGYMLIIK